jgi:5'-3' exonuclease
LIEGEGEHKIMQFIRSMRTDNKFPPNTSHVVFGVVCLSFEAAVAMDNGGNG